MPVATLPRTAPARTRNLQPVMALGRSVGACSASARVYGACVLANYEEVQKDMCAAAFAEFKNCVQKEMRRKW